jgi:ParB family chromosome partitioning protein
MQARMMNSPDVAMAAIVQRLLEGVSRRHRYGDNDVLKVSGRPSLDSLHDKAPDLKGMRASVEIRTRIDAWRASIPANSSDELAWLLSLDSAELHELFALCVALSIDATTGDASRTMGADLSAALQIDVADYWQATEVSYFSAVSKDTILAAVEEACGPGSGMPIVKMKKGEASKYAEQKLAGTRWLPMMLREQAVAAPADTLTASPVEAVSQRCDGVETGAVDGSAVQVADQTPVRGTDTAESGDTDAHALMVTAAEAE